MNNEINLEKIVEKSKQWTLEGDCTLLQWMNQISNNLEERVTKTSSALNEMSTKLDRTSVALSNVTNNLSALQYSKFVENRVHDDDETLANPPSVVPAEDVPDNNTPGQDIYSFLKKNLEMMNSCHEAYSISYEDSDDDDDEPVTNVVYRSKNPYEARPLPHIYGSTLWKEKWHIGLCDSDNDFSGDENSEQFSESSASTNGSYESTAPTISEWDSTAWGLNTQHNASAGAGERRFIRTPSNDGDSSYQGEDYSQSKVSTPTPQRSMSSAVATQQPVQDQRYYHHVPQRQGNLFDDHDIFNESSRSQEVANPVAPPPIVQQTTTAPQRKTIPESYIPNEPPPDEPSSESDNNRRVGAKKTLNLFDDDEFSSFMDQIVQKAATKNPTRSNESPQPRNVQPEPPKKPVVPNLFNDPVPPVEDDIFQQRQPTKSEPPKVTELTKSEPPKVTVPSPKPGVQVLPSNLFTDSDDLFSRVPEKPQEPPKPSVAPNLFNDSDDLFAPSTSSRPAAAVTVKRRSPSPKPEDDIFPPSPKPVSTVIGRTKIKNLFDDDDDDDDFDSIFAASKSQTPNKSFTQATKNLFEDESPPEPEQRQTVEPVKVVIPHSAGLFDDVKVAPEVEKAPIVEKQSQTDGIATSVLKKIQPKGLFDDFDDFDDDNDLFAPKPAKKDSFENLFEKENPREKLSAVQSKSLFGDEDDESRVKDSREIKKTPGDEDVVKAKALEQPKEKELDDDTPKKKPNLFSDLTNPKKMQKVTPVDDMFADSTPDEFEDLIPSNSGESEKVEHKLTDIPKPLMTPSESQVTIASVAPKLPVIAQKPSIDKTSKPKIVPRKLAEKPKDESTPETKPEPNVKPLETPKATPEITKTFENVAQKKEQLNENPTFRVDPRPTPKPKPIVVVTEDLKIPSSSRKNSIEDPPPEQQPEKKPSPIPSYTSLFHDDVPPEDENPNPTSNEESPMHTVDEDVDVKPVASSSTVSYNSLNLFTDVPPDDYFSISTSNTPPAAAEVIAPESEPAAGAQESQTKRIHSIFYDDFPETIEAGREMRTPSNYMFNDEPPPDDSDNKPIVSEVQKEKPKVSKLKKMDIKINVGALLPSAKMPSFKKPPTVEKAQISENIAPSTGIEDVSPPPPLQASQTRQLPDNILPNLNRDRAKVQVKRRPSTRTARQERYRQSTIEEEGALAFAEESETDNLRELEPKTSSTIEGFVTSKVEQVPKQQASPPNSSSFLDELNRKLDLTEESRGDSEKMPDQAALFKESDNIFNKKVSSATALKSTSKMPSLFNDSDSEPENIFETMKSVIGTLAKPESQKSSPAAKITDSLFDSDGIDENPFGTPKSFLPEKEIQTQPIDKTKSVLDTQAKESKSQPAKPTSLFDDSDDGSDDLFGGTRTSKKSAVPVQKKTEIKPRAKPSKPSASLFSSDEGDGSGDDLFGKPKTKTAPRKKVESAKDKAPSASSSLFADLSDDDSDGLFGSSTKKTIGGANKPSKKPATTERVQAIKQPAQAQPAKAIGSNPLADLLGP